MGGAAPLTGPAARPPPPRPPASRVERVTDAEVGQRPRVTGDEPGGLVERDARLPRDDRDLACPVVQDVGRLVAEDVLVEGFRAVEVVDGDLDPDGVHGCSRVSVTGGAPTVATAVTSVKTSRGLALPGPGPQVRHGSDCRDERGSRQLPQGAQGGSVTGGRGPAGQQPPAHVRFAARGAGGTCGAVHRLPHATGAGATSRAVALGPRVARRGPRARRRPATSPLRPGWTPRSRHGARRPHHGPARPPAARRTSPSGSRMGHQPAPGHPCLEHRGRGPARRSRQPCCRRAQPAASHVPQAGGAAAVDGLGAGSAGLRRAAPGRRDASRRQPGDRHAGRRAVRRIGGVRHALGAAGRRPRAAPGARCRTLRQGR